MTVGLFLLAVLTIAYSLLAKRLSNTFLTAPIVFIGIGFAFSQTGLMPEAASTQALHVLAEIALVMLLFLDAAQTNLGALRSSHVWPLRMLIIGLPLSMALGTFVAFWFLDGWPIFAVALVAAILAPTDLGLGQIVVTNPIVPERSRQALTVEAGLNDGLALPAVLLFASLTSEVMEQGGTEWILFAAKQLALGPLVGAGIGLAGGWLLMRATERQLTSDPFEGAAAFAIAGAAYLGATAVDGNGFISAFIAGLCFGNVARGRCKFVYEFTESEGQLLSWAAFFLIGLAVMPQALEQLTWPMLAIIALTLLVVRPVAIWVSLIGSDASPTTRLFFGWFGPHGLATALFTLLVVGRISPDVAEPILAIAVNMVWISALAHGITAAPAARWYAARVEAMGESAESKDVGPSAKPLITWE